MSLARIGAVALTLLMSSPARATDVLLHAAGSLRDALTDVAAAYEKASGNTVRGTYGASGTLRDRIAAGERAEVFASANMAHPQSLAAAGMSGPVVMFARNRLCALLRPGLGVTPETLLEHLLSSGVKLATSTPKADPSGDYAFEVFAKAEALKPGAKAALEAKALTLSGAPDSARPPEGRNLYGWHVAEGRADIYLCYCTAASAAQRENPAQQIVALPDALAIGADYGLTVMNGAPATAHHFALFILSDAGQRILARHGFSAPLLTQ
ncbi:MAG: molybdate ABC transporter substrate-binding protein [Alphaproteobacteria bacterium]